VACIGRYRPTFTTTLRGCLAKTRLLITSPFATVSVSHSSRSTYSSSSGCAVVSGPTAAALIVALLFASRLANTETMLYTSQMQTLMPVTFSLLAIKAYLEALDRDYHPGLLVASTAFVFLGLLCKETVVTIPPLCLLFAFSLATSSSRRGAVQVALAALPLVGLLAWYLLANQILLIQNNPYWQYQWSPPEITGNFIAYLLSYSNLAVRPVQLVDPAVFLNAYPAIMQAQQSLMLRIGFWIAIVLSATAILLARWGRGAWRPSHHVVLTALGFAIFVAALAPVVIFKDRLLMYYGDFGLSVVLVGAAQVLLRRLLALEVTVSKQVPRFPTEQNECG